MFERFSSPTETDRNLDRVTSLLRFNGTKDEPYKASRRFNEFVTNENELIPTQTRMETFRARPIVHGRGYVFETFFLRTKRLAYSRRPFDEQGIIFPSKTASTETHLEDLLQGHSLPTQRPPKEIFSMGNHRRDSNDDEIKQTAPLPPGFFAEPNVSENGSSDCSTRKTVMSFLFVEARYDFPCSRKVPRSETMIRFHDRSAGGNENEARSFIGITVRRKRFFYLDPFRRTPRPRVLAPYPRVFSFISSVRPSGELSCNLLWSAPRARYSGRGGK